MYCYQTVDTSDLIKKADNDTKIEDITKKVPNHNKYVTNNNFNKFPGAIFDERLKEAKLATNNCLNTVEQRATRNNRIGKLQTFDLSIH